MASVVLATLVFLSGEIPADPREPGRAPALGSKRTARSELTYEILVRWLTTRKITTLEELLKTIDDSPYSSYLKHFTLMYKSQSTQKATFENPRVILSGDSARLVLAFNGNPEAKGYDQLEIMQFRDETASFEFHEIAFPGPRSRERRVAVSETNPARCLGCHGALDPRPNWENYASWPGAYGSSDDRLFEDQEEIAGLRAFIERFKQHSRYRFLADVKKSYALENEHPRSRARGSHNIKLTQRLAVLNFQRIHRLMREQPGYAYLLPAIVGANSCVAYGSARLSGFFPEGFEKFLGHGDYPIDRKYSGGKFDWLEYLFHGHRVPVRQWHMSFNAYNIEGFDTPFAANSGGELAALLIQDNPEVAALFEVRHVGEYGSVFLSALPKDASIYLDYAAREKACAALKALSLRYLSRWMRSANGVLPIPAPLARRDGPQLLRQCQSCHIDASKHERSIPALRFNSLDDASLGNIEARLTTDSATSKMPPQGMDDSERKLLLEYIRLAK